MTYMGRLPDIHVVMDFALQSTALMTDSLMTDPLMTGPLMTGVPCIPTVPEITALGQAMQARVRPTRKCHEKFIET
jgi:hypothetical protein